MYFKRRRRKQKKRINKIRGKGIQRPYINKRNRLIFGKGKKQKGGFFGGAQRPYVNTRNRLMLGKGKKQKGGFIGPVIAAAAPALLQTIGALFR